MRNKNYGRSNNKLFNTILNRNSKTSNLKPKQNLIGNMKYLPSFAKEWKNTIYSFNKNKLKDFPMLNINLNGVELHF